MRTKLDAKKNLINGRQATLDTLHNEILAHCDIDSVGKEIVEREEVESEIEEIICIMEHALADKWHPAATFAPPTNVNHSSNSQNSRDSIKMKLPKLTLPSFNGDITQWTNIFGKAFHIQFTNVLVWQTLTNSNICNNLYRELPLKQ